MFVHKKIAPSLQARANSKAACPRVSQQLFTLPDDMLIASIAPLLLTHHVSFHIVIIDSVQTPDARLARKLLDSYL